MVLTSALTSWDARICSSGTLSPSTSAEGEFLSPPTLAEPASSKEGFVHRLFDSISPRYDLFNQVSSFGLDQRWRRRTIQSLDLKPGMQVLDLASGTGDLAAEAARAILPFGKVIACDLSHPMLRLGKSKLARHPAFCWHVEFAQGKAEALPFCSESFHAATMGFALRNVSDLDTTFREFARVVKPNGRLALLEFGRPKGILAAGHWLWLTLGVPMLGLITTGSISPFLYLRRSILQFLPPEQVVQCLKAAGFVDVQAQPINGGIVYLYSAQRPSN